MSAKQTKGCPFPEERVAPVRVTGGSIFFTFTLYVAFMWIFLGRFFLPSLKGKVAAVRLTEGSEPERLER